MRNHWSLLMLVTVAVLLAGCEPSPWEQAQNADTIEALEAFVAQNPDSEHVAEANVRIDALWNAGWDEVAARNTRDGYIEFLRAGAPNSHTDAARNAVIALQEQPDAAAGYIEMYGAYGPSGLIEDVEVLAARYDGVVAGLPASVEYSIRAGTGADGTQQYFSFDWSERKLSFGAPASVNGYVDLQTGSGESVRYELFGLIPGPDDGGKGSFLVGRGPELLWSRVEGMTLAPSAAGEAPQMLDAGAAVLFALNDNLGLEHVP